MMSSPSKQLRSAPAPSQPLPASPSLDSPLPQARSAMLNVACSPGRMTGLRLDTPRRARAGSRWNAAATERLSTTRFSLS
jgi:hypothetical protein